MEGSHYVDIFATKGIEYLIVIVFLLSLVIFWRFLNKPARSSSGEPVTAEKLRTSLIDWFYLADDFFYHQGHSWIAPENNNVVRVGIDDFAQKLLGKPTKVHLPEIGSKIVQGNVGWQLQIGSKSIDILSPVNGEVVEVNEEIIKSPEIINEDPYKNGWLLKVKVPKLGSTKKNLLSGDMAKVWMEQTVNSLSEKLTGNVGVLLQDGGVPITGFIKEISPEDWDDFTGEFLFTHDRES